MKRLLRRVGRLYRASKQKFAPLWSWVKKGRAARRLRAIREWARRRQAHAHEHSHRHHFWKVAHYAGHLLKRLKRKKTYGAGGWAPPGPWRLQRVDQGQDFEIPVNHYIQAPGSGVCVAHLADGPWPNGFGNPYAVVRINDGPFAIGDRLWYIGHCGNNGNIIPVGKSFKFGDKLAQANNGLNAGWGWCELGKATGGSPGPFGTGANYAHLFKNIKR